MKNKKLILFDFDGVLVDTLGVAFNINVEVMPDLSLETYKSFFEGNIHDAIASGKKKRIPDFDDKFRSYTRELKIPEALKKVLQSLSSSNIITIVSSSSTNIIKEIITREKVDTYFSDVFGGDVHTNKVTKIKTLLEKYGISPGKAVFITDTLGDILEAKACGVKSIAVSWGFHDLNRLEKGNPFKIVHTPEELLSSIEGVL